MGFFAVRAKALAVVGNDDDGGIAFKLLRFQCRKEFADGGIDLSDSGVIGCSGSLRVADMQPQKKWPLSVAINP